MDVELRVDEIEVGAVVEISHKYYMVQQLPPCIGDYQYLGHRFYLQSLSGYGCWDYPNTLSQLKIIIANAKGRVYGLNSYKAVILPND